MATGSARISPFNTNLRFMWGWPPEVSTDRGRG
jgi:hypothetical protein